jgi:uncharacterized repeat protein (TIGR03847 family)
MHDLGPVARVAADAVGEPGQRRFRLLALGADGTSVVLWLEKEELQALAAAIEQLLLQLARDPRLETLQPPPPPGPSAGDFPPHANVEFAVHRMALGYDEALHTFFLLVHDGESDPEGPPTLMMAVDELQLRQLRQQAAAVVASGRPRCPLCGELISERHVCVRSNGHH